jgi:hypothetical protein
VGIIQRLVSQTEVHLDSFPRILIHCTQLTLDKIQWHSLFLHFTLGVVPQLDPVVAQVDVQEHQPSLLFPILLWRHQQRRKWNAIFGFQPPDDGAKSLCFEVSHDQQIYVRPLFGVTTRFGTKEHHALHVVGALHLQALQETVHGNALTFGQIWRALLAEYARSSIFFGTHWTEGYLTPKRGTGQTQATSGPRLAQYTTYVPCNCCASATNAAARDETFVTI